MSNIRVNDDGEKEKYCRGCKEWWPADKEFFYSAGKGKLWSLCKACYLERRYPNGRGKRTYQVKGEVEILEVKIHGGVAR